jgi:hypothetical protein
MDLHVPITEDLISILERVLDKSIVVESRSSAGLQGCDLLNLDLKCSLASSSVYAAYGEFWQEDRETQKLFLSGGAISGPNNAIFTAKNPKSRC